MVRSVVQLGTQDATSRLPHRQPGTRRTRRTAAE